MAITTQMRTDVAGLYAAFFGRAPERDGLGYWVQQLDAGKTVAQVAQEMYNTEPARAFYPTFLTNEEVIARFYVNVLGRTADADGLAYWTAKLNAGESKGSVIAEMITAVTSFTGTGTDELSVAARTSKALFDNKVSVGLNYAVTLGLNDVAKAAEVLKLVTATDTTAANNLAAGTSTAGQTLALTTGSDTVTGTAGNDIIKAATGLSADGTTVIATTNALDSIDGGAGTDTLVIENTGGKNTLIGTITNVENLTFVGAGKINNDADISSTDFSGTITFKQTDVWAVGQKVTGLKGQTVALDTVADATIATLAYDAAQTSATIANAKAAGDATVSLSGAKIETVNITTDKTATGKTLTVTDSGDTTKAVNIAASGAAAVTVNSAALESVVVTGAGAVTLAAGTAPSKSLSSADSTGGVTYAVDLVAQQFTGGAGKDNVQFGATTKAQTLGAGDDKATISADFGTGGSIDAGDGTDTLVMTATLADSLDANTNFNAKVVNFEKLGLTTVGTETLDLANLDALNYVSLAGQTGAGGVTLNNFASGGTLEITDTAAKATAVVKDSASNTTDVFNVVATAAASKNVGTVVVANVETININSDDTATTPGGAVKHTVVLTADKATKVVVSGDAQLDLTLTGSTKVAAIDASANTAGITTNLGVASGITLTGTAKADTITLGNLSVVTGGAGKDAYTVATPTNGNTYATIADFAVGETIQFTDRGDNGTGTAFGAKLSLAATAAFADYLAAASAGNGGTNGIVEWFQFGGDTYLVLDRSAEATFQNGADEIVKLTGVLDLSKSTITTAGLVEYVAV